MGTALRAKAHKLQRTATTETTEREQQEKAYNEVHAELEEIEGNLHGHMKVVFCDQFLESHTCNPVEVAPPARSFYKRWS